MGGESPDVLRVSEARLDSPETSFRELDDAFLQTQARIWLGEVLHIRFDEETTVADLLADGELLFQVSKVIWKMLSKKSGDLKDSNVYIHERTSFGKSDGRYMPYPKVDSFLKELCFQICRILGLKGIDMFSSSDVVEKRDVRRVCMCIRSLSKKARLENLKVPDFDIVTYTIAMPTVMVGGICRYLEQSQHSSPSSSSCSSSMDSRQLYIKRRFSRHFAQYPDSYSESDEAESGYAECHSPISNSSYDDASLPSLVGDDSPEGRPFVDANVADPHKTQLYSQEKPEHGHISNSNVLPLCGECRTDASATISPIGMRESLQYSNPNYGTEVTNGEEKTIGSYISSKLSWREGLEDYLFECVSSDSHTNIEHGNDHNKAYTIPSDQAQKICCIPRDNEENGDESLVLLGCSDDRAPHDRNPRFKDSMRSLNNAYEECMNSSDDKEESSDGSSLVINNGDSFNAATSNSFQRGISELEFHRINDCDILSALPANSCTEKRGSSQAAIPNGLEGSSEFLVMESEASFPAHLNAFSKDTAPVVIDGLDDATPIAYADRLNVTINCLACNSTCIEEVERSRHPADEKYPSVLEGEAMCKSPGRSTLCTDLPESPRDETTQLMANGFSLRKAGNMGLDNMITKRQGLERGGTKFPLEPNFGDIDFLRSRDSVLSRGIHSSNLEAQSQGGDPSEVAMSDSFHDGGFAGTSSSLKLEEACMQTQISPSCSSPTLTDKEATAKRGIEVEDQVLPSMDHVDANRLKQVPSAFEERKFDSGKNELVPTKVGESAGDKGQKKGDRILKSVAGGVTFVGAVILFLHLRQKRGREKPVTIVPSKSQEQNQEISRQEEAETGKSNLLQPRDSPLKQMQQGKSKSNVLYPAEKLKL